MLNFDGNFDGPWHGDVTCSARLCSRGGEYALPPDTLDTLLPHKLDTLLPNGVFTLPDTDTNIKTDKLQQYSKALLSR